jgi:hypothetical protein
MKKAKLESIDIGLKEKLKSDEFRRLYEFECAKIALVPVYPPLFRTHPAPSSALLCKT